MNIRAVAGALCAAIMLASVPAARGAGVADARLYITRHMNAYGLMDGQGAAVTQTYPYIERLADRGGGTTHCFVYYQYDPAAGRLLAGALDSAGREVLEARFDHITLENGFLFTEEGGGALPLKSAAYTLDGDEVLPPGQGRLSFNGFLLRRELESAAVYYHADGSPAPAFNRFDYVREAYGGLCAAAEDGKSGFIDTNGDVRISFAFDGATDFLSGNYASVTTDGQNFLIDKNGDYVYGPTPMYMYYDGVCWIGNGEGRAMLMDDMLNTLVEIIDEGAYIAAANGYYRITDAQGTRYVDARGEPVMEGPYASAESIGGGLFCVTYQGKGGEAHVVGADGAELFTLPGMLTASVSNGYVIAVAERNGRTLYAMYSMDGRQLLSPIYALLEPMNGDVIEARVSTESGYIRPDGSWIYCISDHDKLID